MPSRAEAILTALMQSTEDYIWSVDLDFKLLTFSRALKLHIEKTFGTKAEVGKLSQEFLPSEIAANWPPLYHRAITEGPFQTGYSFRSGQTLEISLTPIDLNGKTIGVSVFGKDISEPKAALSASKEAESKYHRIFDNASEGIFQTTDDGQPFAANASLANMLGYDSPLDFESSVKSTSHDLWLNPDDRVRFVNLLETSDTLRSFECQFKRKDHSPIWVSLSARKMPASDGKSILCEAFVRDITGRKTAEQSLAESENRFHNIFTQNASVMLFLDPVTAVIANANPAAATYYGYPLDQLIGMSISNINSQPESEFAIERQFALHRDRRCFHTRHRLASGDLRDVEIFVSPVNVNGKDLLLSDIHDVTDRKRTENLLRESLESLQEAQIIGELGSYVLDIPAGVWTCSLILDQILGIDEKYQRTLQGWADLVHPEDREMMASYFANEVATQGKAFDREYRIIRPGDHTTRWVHGVGRLEFDAHGLPQKMIGVIQDISERKLADMLLRDSEERFRATFEQAAIGIVHLSFAGRILRCNARFAATLGYTAKELTGVSFADITPSEYLPESQSVFDQLNKGVPVVSNWVKPYIRKDGTLVWVRLTSSVQRDASGRALHFITFVEDINAQRQAEESLLHAQEAQRASEERYRLAFQMNQDSVVISRLEDGTLLDVNEAFCRDTGFSRAEVLGKTAESLKLLANPEDKQVIFDALNRSASFRDIVAPFRKKNGETVWGQMSATTIQLDGAPCLLSVTRDISEARAGEERLKAAQNALIASENRYRTAFETSLDSISISSLQDGRYIDVNQAFINLLGFERDEILGRTSVELDLWADSKGREIMVEMLLKHSSFRDMTVCFKKRGGDEVWLLISASVIEIESSKCVLTVMRDISDARAAEDEIRHLAFYDTLTRLPNRRMLMDQLDSTLTANLKVHGRQAALLVDLDDFKTLNDTMGHQTGDLLLLEVARCLLSCIRAGDTVSRVGGDEFVVILRDLSEIPEEAAFQAMTVAEKIQTALNRPYILSEHEVYKSACIGVALIGPESAGASDVLKQTEIALFKAKGVGRDSICFFAPDLQAAVNARATLEDSLRVAIGANEFLLYYQPQVDSTGLIGAEALIRWKHQERGILAPGEFISLAEETGLIVPLGLWILEAACKQIALWAAHCKSSRITLAVNISARQFRHPDFVRHTLAVLERTGANPKNLKLELTESMLVQDIEDVIAKMTLLKSHGLRFSMDDFGTGYSSLSYLKRMPLDQLKIDRAFVRDILVDTASDAIAQTIISLGRAMHMSVIAEGVETEEQREFLSSLGCHAFQGFLYSRPLPLDEFERLWLHPAA